MMKELLSAIIVAFQNGGDFMYFILIMDKLLLVMAIILIILNKRKALLFGLIATALPLILGIIAYVSNMHDAEAAIQSADPDHQSMLLDVMKKHSIIPLKFGIYSTLFFFIPVYIRLFLNRKT